MCPDLRLALPAIPFLHVAVLVLMLLAGCGSDETTAPPSPAGYVYGVPEQIAGDWETASLGSVGMDAGPVASLILGRAPWQHGILIVRNGKLVLEEYFDGEADPWTEPWAEVGFTVEDHIDFTRDTLHYQASVTKSFVSALVGIAIDRGLVDGADQTIKDFFPDYADLFEGTKNDITVGDLLTMRSGIHWGDRSTYNMDHHHSDWVRYVLSRPMVAEPGTVWRYNDGLSVLLAEIVGRVFGMRADRVAEEVLFGPIGIDDYMWMRSPTDQIAGGWGLYLRPRDMARLGQLFLDDGVWEGEQVVSAEWVRESTRTHVSGVAGSANYCYHWWQQLLWTDTLMYQSFSARGAGGQYIWVVPLAELVVVFTGEGETGELTAREAMQEYILPACR